MCNGVPKVYDSGINKIITADWKSPEGIKKLLKMENKYWGKEYFINITCYIDVYVNKEAQEGRCP
jgi:mRNA-degrading endonuclease HigB of HigAB toxin-antitoxin module